MKHKTSELSGALLNLAVHKAREVAGCETLTAGFSELIAYSTSWAIAGPIIERERISVIAPTLGRHKKTWVAVTDVVETYAGLELDHEQEGETALIAAMRAFVASKMGDEVEL